MLKEINTSLLDTLIEKYKYIYALKEHGVKPEKFTPLDTDTLKECFQTVFELYSLYFKFKDSLKGYDLPYFKLNPSTCMSSSELFFNNNIQSKLLSSLEFKTEYIYSAYIQIDDMLNINSLDSNTNNDTILQINNFISLLNSDDKKIFLSSLDNLKNDGIFNISVQLTSISHPFIDKIIDIKGSEYLKDTIMSNINLNYLHSFVADFSEFISLGLNSFSIQRISTTNKYKLVFMSISDSEWIDLLDSYDCIHEFLNFFNKLKKGGILSEL